MSEADLGAHVGFGFGLDALRDRVDQQVAGHRDERGQEPPPRRGSTVDPPDEAHVELQEVRGDLGQLEEARLPGPEIVVSEVDPYLRELRPQAVDAGGVGQGAFVDLEGQAQVRGEALRLRQRLHEARFLELGGVRVEEEHGQVASSRHQLEGLPAEKARQLGFGPHPGGDVEELGRLLGEARMAAAAQHLVAGDDAARQAHDRLEDDADHRVAQQLGHLPRPLDEAVRKRHLGDGDGGGLHLVGVLELLPTQAELELREVDDVAFVDGGIAHPVAVDERPVLALEVADSEGLAVLVELGVLLRYGVRGQAELEPGLPTYPEGERVDRDSPELPAAFHEAFQEPTKSGGARRGRRGRFVGHIRGQR